MNNHSLVERIKKADGEKALKEIYCQYRHEFQYWAIRNFHCSLEDAQEIFQQTIITLYEKIVFGKVTEITVQMKTLLFGIGKRKLMEWQRRKNRIVEISEGGESEVDQFEEQEIFFGNLDDEYEARLSVVESCIKQMGDPCRTILQLYYYHKRSMEDIAEKLAYKNSETVKNIKYKCIMRIKKMLLTEGNSLTTTLS